MLETAKAHLKEHKKVYIAAGLGLVVGGVGVVLIQKPTLISTTIKGNHNTVNNIIITALGDPGNIVQCLETGTVYASQNQAARELGVYAARISEQLAGKIPHVKGYHFQMLGKAEVPLAK